MPPITEDQVAALMPALEEAARASQRTVERFVPPRTGIVQQVAAGRHQLVVGRRGVGKTTLLRKTEQHVKQQGAAVTFVDIETLKGIEYPDVLIHLLIQLFESLRTQLRSTGHRRHARQLRRVERTFRLLLDEPQVFDRQVKKGRSRSVSLAGGGALRTRARYIGASLQARFKRSVTEEERAEAAFTHTKMQGLSMAVTDIRKHIVDAAKVLGGSKGFIILDDFYHVRRDDQPYVLGYLHQVLKNLDVYLKIGAVKHRLTSFIDGDPPVGLQLPHDASEVSLDVTLESFDAAKVFLEKVLESIIAPVGARLDELATATARDRLVLASGGVARDYINVVVMALRSANDRPGTPQRPHNRITAEDVNEVVGSLAEQKDADLVRDAGANADTLRALLHDLLTFCLDEKKTNVFLVDAKDLQQTSWGENIQTLADLRFIHRIDSTTIQSSDYRGRRFVAFTLDLSSYTGTRSERISQINFWEPGGASQLRRAHLIYGPRDIRRTTNSDKPIYVEQGKLI